MLPILFEVLGLKVHAYGVFMALACASALGLCVWRARREGMDAAARALDAVIAWCDGLSAGRNATGSVVNDQAPRPVVAGFVGAVVHEPLVAKAR